MKVLMNVDVLMDILWPMDAQMDKLRTYVQFCTLTQSKGVVNNVGLLKES